MRDDCVIGARLGAWCAGLLAVLTMGASCERRAVVPTAVPMTDPLYEAQKESFAEQTKTWDEQMDRMDVQDQRYEALLKRWEERADRVDRLLDRWEELLAGLDARTAARGDPSTEP